MNIVYRVEWTEHEYEEGWGASTRDGGCTYTLTEEAMQGIIASSAASDTYELYYRHNGIKQCVVTDEMFATLKEVGHIATFKGDHPGVLGMYTPLKT